MFERETAPPSLSPPAALNPNRLEAYGLDPALLPDALAMRDWLLAEAARTHDLGQVLSGFAGCLNALGIPIDRLTNAIDALHSEYSGIGRYWTLEGGATYQLFPHGAEADRLYAESPFAHVHRTREWLLLDLS